MHVCSRMLAATAILILPLASPAAPTTCPSDWTPSPANAKWGGARCYLVPPERSTSLFHCVDLCGAHGGLPACIGSAGENDYVTTKLAASDGLWLGLYQNETGLGPTKGWDRCVAGDAPSFTNWKEGEPGEFAGYQQDCAFLNARSGQWSDLECNGSGYFELSCLCARGNASAAFAGDLKALVATGAYNQRLLRRRTVHTYCGYAHDVPNNAPCRAPPCVTP